MSKPKRARRFVWQQGQHILMRVPPGLPPFQEEKAVDTVGVLSAVMERARRHRPLTQRALNRIICDVAEQAVGRIARTFAPRQCEDPQRPAGVA